MRPCVMGLLIVATASCAATSTTNTPATAFRYLALGDSFTIGTGSTPSQSFPARLVARWGCPVDLQNLGVNGFTTDNLMTHELPEVAPFSPELVTLAIGANDIVHGTSTATYRAHVHEILAAVAAAGVKRIIAIPQPDWAESPTAAAFGTPSVLHGRIVDFNAVLAAETQGVGGVFVDLFPLMEQQASRAMLASDGLHPSTAAYDAWAEALAKSIPSPCSP